MAVSVAARAFDSRASESALRAEIGSGAGSIRPKHAFAGEHEAGAARRARWHNAENSREQLEPPAGMQGHDAAGELLE